MGKRERGNGDGAPYYDATKQRWVAYVTVSGRRVKRYVKTEREARRVWRELQAKHAAGALVVNDRITVEQWAAQWLPLRTSAVDPITASRYADHVRLRIVPTLGALTLGRVTQAECQAVVDALLSLGTARTTVAATRMLLADLFNAAVERGLLRVNPATGTRLPRARREQADGRDAIPPEQLRRLFAAIRGHVLEPFWVLAFASGLRRGELLGLRWSGLNTATGTLTVHGQFKRTPDGFKLVDFTKSRRGRTIRLPAPVLALLEVQRARVATMRAEAGEQWQEHDLVFCSRYGRPLSATWLAGQYRAALAAAGLPDMPIHGTRHSAATYMLMEGISDREVQEILGHSSAETTRRYTHVLPAMSERSAELMGRFIERLTGTDG
jgi:integrase